MMSQVITESEWALQARALGIEFRPGQAQLYDIGTGLAHGDSALVKAPTATGKSMAALAIAARRAAMGQRTVIATFTRLLQDQYADSSVGSDLDKIRKTYPDVTFAVLKGATNYLCRDQAQNLADSKFVAFHKSSGDPGEVKDNLPYFEARADAEACQGHNPDRCGYAAAKQSASKAQVIITNHALVLIAANHPVFGEHDLLIVDEIHNFSRAADAYGTHIVNLDKLLPVIARLGADDDAWSIWATRIESAIKLLWKPRTSMLAAEALKPGPVYDKFMALGLDKLPVSNKMSSIQQGWVSLLRRFIKIIRVYAEKRQWADHIALVQPKHRLSVSLVDIAPVASRGLRTLVNYGPVLNEDEAVDNSFKRAVLMMSATIGTPDFPDFTAAQCGVTDVKVSHVLSALDYPNQMRVSWTPSQNLSWGEHTLRLIRQTRGRTLVLMRSWRRVEEIATYLSDAKIPVNIYVQNRETPEVNRTLVEQFSIDTDSVMIGTASFFEGINVPGESLSQVIIGELPMFMALDPLSQERRNRLGRNFYPRLQIPHTALVLQQMMGRLIRSVADRGVVAVLDDSAGRSWGSDAFTAAVNSFGMSPTGRDQAIQWLRSA